MEHDEELEGVVNLIAGLTTGLTDSDTGQPISDSGVGCNGGATYANEVFAIRDFCWCEGRFHPEVAGYDDMDDNTHYAAMSASGGTSTGCPPNFEHFASGITGVWYKHLGRDTVFNRYARPGEALEILRDCLASLPEGHPHRVREDAATRAAWGWKK